MPIETPPEQIRISLLGTLDVSQAVGGSATIWRPVVITAVKPRQVLAMLAANASAMVDTDLIVDELWPNGPPSTVKTIVQTYIYQLRQQLGKALPAPHCSNLLVTRPSGYMLTVPRANVDIFRFEQLTRSARAALREDQPARSSDLLGESLALWRGPALADVSSGPNLHALAVYLDEQRLEAVILRIDADLANNRHREIIPELRRLVAAHQLREPFYVRLMQALCRSGRRGEALTVYHQLCRVLDHDLGVEPSSEAQQIQHQILNSA